MKVLVTGSAGFIGYHLAERLLARGDRVVGVDNLNDYYDVTLKEARLARLSKHAGFDFRRLDIADHPAMESLFRSGSFDAIVNLAAQAGVRYSLQNPQAYVNANVTGFLNVLEGVRHTQPQAHLVYASTSSVYGLNTAMPFAESQTADHPVSLYAATKRANELMAHSYSHLFGLRCTGLRFFTVYGPWGRPDMALFLFTKAMLEGRPINLFNEGKMIRDFTYVDDIVEGVVRIVDRPASPDPDWNGDRPNPGTSKVPWRVYNIGNNQRVELMRYVRAIEAKLGIRAELNLMPMQAGDVEATEADTTALSRAVGFKPATPLEEGVARFVRWYREYYGAGRG